MGSRGYQGAPRSQPLRALALRPGYLRLFAAATTARLAAEMWPVAAVLLVLDRTGSAGLAGATVAAITFPSLLSGPLLGAVLDRSPHPERWLAADQAVSAASLLLLSASVGSAPDWLLPLLALPAGLTFPLSTGGFTSLLPAIAGRELLLRANTLEATSFHLGIVAGPALAGTVAALASPVAAVLAQAGLKLVALVLALGLPRARRAAAGAAGLATRVAAGLRHLVHTTPLLAVTVAGGLSLAGRGLLTVAFPLFAVERLGEAESFAGFLWAAFAVGSIAGALGLAHLQGRWRHERLALVSIAASGTLMALWPIAGSAVAALALVALAGLAYGPGFAAQFGVRQEWAPEELQAQVLTTAASLKPALFAVGAALAGPAVELLGTRGTLLAAAAMQGAATIAGTLLLSRGPAAR